MSAYTVNNDGMSVFGLAGPRVVGKSQLFSLLHFRNALRKCYAPGYYWPHIT